MKEFPIIDKLGGREAVYEHLRQTCGIKTRDALRMWRARGRIPSKPLHALIDLAADRGIGFVPADLRLGEQSTSTEMAD